MTNTATFDPSTYNQISLGGARYNVDELRIGTTFDDVIGVVAATDGPYWAAVAGGGGAGTWSSDAAVWASVPNATGTLLQRSGVALIFSGTVGQVLIDGTSGQVAADAGLQFLTTGYSLDPGTTSPTSLSLSGATIGANTITVDTGKTATISTEVTGSNGMTKDGAGTLVLSNTANGYSGGTQLNAGTLNIADVGSLGTGTVTFGGGTLQYPAGIGTTMIDVSGKIAAVPSGQVAMIDTNGFDVSFGSALSGDGGLTKLGAGSLTLAGSVTSLTGTVTVSAGTLDVSSASGTIAKLDIPAGGTAVLNGGATLTTLDVTGGTASVAAGVTADFLVTTGGTLSASAGNPLSVANSATFNGITISRTGVNPMTLSGTNIAAPTTVDRATISASAGELGVAVQGLDIGIGKGSPGSPALPATATFLGSGAWTMSGGQAQTIDNGVYGNDNHSFHYIQVPAGDFDIIANVTGSANASVGLMARDNLMSRWDSNSGDWAGIWAGSNTEYRVSGTCVSGVMSLQKNLPCGATPWLRVTKVGNVVTTYYSSDGINYTQAQQHDYTASPWSSTTCYVGLDMINTSAASPASASFSDVNLMGTASIPEMRIAEFKLTDGAKMNLAYNGAMRIGALSIDAVPQADGTYGSSSASPVPGTIDDVHFAGTGTVQLGRITPVITWSDPAPIVVGTPLSATQLNAAPSVPGELTFTPPIDTLLPLGSHTLHVDFAPTDTDSYNPTSKEVTLVVEKATPVITWYTPEPITAGTPLSTTELSATCPVDGIMTYTPDVGTVLGAGSHTLHVDFAPTDTDSYNPTFKEVTLMVTVVTGSYADWALTNAPAPQTAGDDYDNDGVPNGVEYFMGVAAGDLSFTANPALDAGNMITWQMSATFSGDYEVQTSPDLGTWTNVVPKPTPASGNLTYTLPSGLGKQFVRLLVTPN